MSNNERLSLYDAIGIEQGLRSYLQNLSKQYWVAGSIRRESPTVGDIELVILPHNPQALYTRLDNMLEKGIIKQALYNTAHGMKPRWGERLRCFRFKKATVELAICNQHNIGYILWLRTGPADANHYIMSRLDTDKAPLRFNDGHGWVTDYEGEYPLYQKKLSIPTEEALFSMLNLPFIFPQWRAASIYQSNWMGTLPRNLLKPHIIDEPTQRTLL